MWWCTENLTSSFAYRKLVIVGVQARTVTQFELPTVQGAHHVVAFDDSEL